jgi:hypothetical protein
MLYRTAPRHRWVLRLIGPRKRNQCRHDRFWRGLRHPDLVGAIAGGRNLINDNDQYFDDYFHGTLVADVIGARDNGFGTIGVAPEARLWAVRIAASNGGGGCLVFNLGKEQTLSWTLYGHRVSSDGRDFAESDTP